MIPLWDELLLGAGTFLNLLPSVRLLWLAGFFGGGKTLLATVLAAKLLHDRVVARVHSNIAITGTEPIRQHVPLRQRYYSNYLERWFESGEMMPVEDAALILDEAGVFIEDWKSAKDYVGFLRKTNLFFLMPSYFQPAARVRSFEVRRTANLYKIGLPLWIYSWQVVNGSFVVERGRFLLWRPHRVFGVFKTGAVPSSDGDMVECLEYTFKVGAIREFKSRQTARKVIAFGGFESASTSDSADIITDAVSEMEVAMEKQAARLASGGTNGRRK